jgi:cold shock CspA family protein
MVDDLVPGRVTAFQRQQGFGVITLDDGRAVKFDASICTMVPEEGAAVRLRIGPAKWGGGFKALHVEPGASSTLFAAAPLTLDQQIAALQREHLAGALSEHVMAQIAADSFGGRLDNATLLDVIDAFYRLDPISARHDGYLRLERSQDNRIADAVAAIAAVLPGAVLSSAAAPTDVDDAVAQANQALAAAGDPRRLYQLRTPIDRRAYLVLTADRAKQIAKILRFE